MRRSSLPSDSTFFVFIVFWNLTRFFCPLLNLFSVYRRYNVCPNLGVSFLLPLLFQVIRLRPVSSCCNRRLEVYINGKYAVKLRRMKKFFITPKYVVCDANGTNVLKICAPGIGENQNRFVLRVSNNSLH